MLPATAGTSMDLVDGWDKRPEGGMLTVRRKGRRYLENEEDPAADSSSMRNVRVCIRIFQGPDIVPAYYRQTL